MNISIYNGCDDCYWWILCTEKYFVTHRIPEEEKVASIVPVLRGRALQWWFQWSQRYSSTSWDAFTTAILWYFKPEFRDVMPESDEAGKPYSEILNYVFTKPDLESMEPIDETCFHQDFIVEPVHRDLPEINLNLLPTLKQQQIQSPCFRASSPCSKITHSTCSPEREIEDEEIESQGEKSPPKPPPESIFDQPPVPPPPLKSFCYEENMTKNIFPATSPATLPTIPSMISQMKSHATKTSASVFLQESPYQCLPNEFINLSPLCNVEKKHSTVQLKPATRLLHFNHTRPTRLLLVGRPSAHSPILQKGSFLSFENNHPPLHFPQFMQNSSQPFIQKNVPPIAIVITCSSISPLTSIQQDFLSLHTISHSHTTFGQKNVVSHPGTSGPMSSTASLPYFTYQFLKANFNQPHQFGFHKSTNTVSTLAPNSINLQTVHYHSSSLFPSMINKFTKTNFMFPMMLVPFKNTKNEPVLSPETKIYDHKRDCYEQAFKCFRKMQIVGVVSDYVIIMAIIFVCAHLGALGLGLCVHRFAMKKGFRDNVRVSNSLANICVQYGCMKLALKVFDRMTQQILGLTNSIIDSFTQNEFVDEVLSSFHLMRKEEFQSNGVLSIENIHEEVVALIPIIDFWSENSPMNNTDSIVVLAAHSLIKISSENLHSQVGIVVIHGGCPKKSHADFLTKCLIPTRRSFANMHMKPDTETYNWVGEVYTRADSYDRVQDVAELLGMMVEVHKLIQLPSKLKC
ncbi:uncharacterized protein LOC131622810 [Vicia villosa]|uniref:uncharacterized protein LOC131622810 n=1 Tax=Vicia villosa TaxID=3911 RepID=UPI00273BC762|nr:uncharacterized protein LOC131622810 [Vicia villosa]